MGGDDREGGGVQGVVGVLKPVESGVAWRDIEVRGGVRLNDPAN